MELRTHSYPILMQINFNHVTSYKVALYSARNLTGAAHYADGSQSRPNKFILSASLNSF